MAQDTHIVGIDPGIVHTGVVSLRFLPKMREVHVKDHVTLGPDPVDVGDWVVANCHDGLRPTIYIEGFRARSNFGHDQEMQVAVAAMRTATGGKVLDNTGIKKVVKRPVLELLGVWKFSTPTNHDDLRSAARIAVLGMLKHHNELLADVVRDHLDGRPWDVR